MVRNTLEQSLETNKGSVATWEKPRDHPLLALERVPLVMIELPTGKKGKVVNFSLSFPCLCLLQASLAANRNRANLASFPGLVREQSQRLQT